MGSSIAEILKMLLALKTLVALEHITQSKRNQSRRYRFSDGTMITYTVSYDERGGRTFESFETEINGITYKSIFDQSGALTYCEKAEYYNGIFSHVQRKTWAYAPEPGDEPGPWAGRFETFDLQGHRTYDGSYTITPADLNAMIHDRAYFEQTTSF